MEQRITLWQRLPYHMSPDIFTLGAFNLRYYGLISYRLKSEKFVYSTETIRDFFFWGMLGLIIGARLGYVLFYNAGYYAQHPLEIFLPLDFSRGVRFVGISGMSYHGGALGLIIASVTFCHKKN